MLPESFHRSSGRMSAPFQDAASNTSRMPHDRYQARLRLGAVVLANVASEGFKAEDMGYPGRDHKQTDYFNDASCWSISARRVFLSASASVASASILLRLPKRSSWRMGVSCAFVDGLKPESLEIFITISFSRASVLA